MGRLATPLSRRAFLKAAAVSGGALTASGALSGCSAATPQTDAGEVVERPSLCNACSSKCGFMAKVKDGRLWEISGLADHPNSKGKICGRGHGFASVVYSEERLTEPLKRQEDGTFEPISWDDAMAEIGHKIKGVLAEHGPGAISLINDPRPTGKVWTKNFMHALGSNNWYSHAAACDLSRTSAIYHCTGFNSYGADFANAKVVMFIGRSYADGIRPSQIATLANFHERGGKVILVDPRLNNTAIFADKWLAVKPGTDLALLLGIANHLIANDLYDHSFIESETVGFEEWRAAIADYTPAWAARVCDLEEDDIVEVAELLAKCAPAAVIEPGWKAVTGCGYKNSCDTQRAVCMIDALLGNWNRKGGALITGSPSAGAVDKQKFPTPSTPSLKRTGDAIFPLADPSVGSNLAVLEEAREGLCKAVFFYNSNAMQGYANPKAWAEAMQNVDVSVCIDIQMSETAMQCDYVLPECSYLERAELPEWMGGKTWSVALRTQVVDKVHPNTKAADEIFNLLAAACGVGDAFTYSAEELGRAQVESLGLDYDELARKGVLEVPGSKFVYDEMPKWKTPTGKFQFSSQAHADAGLDPLVRWVEPDVAPQEGEFRMVTGKQSIHSHTMTMNNEMLNAISRDYDLERIWMNEDAARELGISDGDLCEVSNDENTAQVRVKTTQRIRRDTLFVPQHYGCASKYLTHAFGYGISPRTFQKPFNVEPGTGATMESEIAVRIKKVSE